MLKPLASIPMPAHERLLSKTSLAYFFSFFIIAFIAWQFQKTLYFSWDNSILLHETQRLLAGGTYTQNFFETSPPMIFYLYMPVVLFSKFFSTPIIATFRAYIFFLVFLCLGLYQFLANHFFKQEDAQLKYVSFFSLMGILLIYPSFELGQRDYLFMLFSIPYLTTVALRIDNIKINSFLATFIGLLMGLGVGIKPYFILTPVLIELYALASAKNLSKCLQPETIAMFIALALYTLVAFYLHIDYFYFVVPYAMRLYYSGIGESWHAVFLHPLHVFAGLTILFYLLQYKNLGAYKTFVTVFFLALTSFMLIFILQRATFIYHFIPFLSLTLFLNVFLTADMFKRSLGNKELAALGLLSLANIAFLIYFKIPLWTLATLAPMALWGFIVFCCLMLLFYFIDGEIRLTRLIFPLATIGCSFWYCHTSIRDQYVGTAMLMLLSLFVIAMRHSHYNKKKLAAMAVFLLLELAYPLRASFLASQSDKELPHILSPVLSFLKTHAQHQTVYSLSNNSLYLFPAVDYTQVNPASRFPMLWMIPGLLKESNLTDNIKIAQRIKDKNFLIGAVTDDLKTKQPTYVLVDASKVKEHIETPFEFLPYFLSSKNFAKEWKNYVFVTTIHGKEKSRFQLEVYKRMPGYKK